jgi:hypothetical protein
MFDIWRHGFILICISWYSFTKKKEEKKTEWWFAFVQFYVQQCLESYFQFLYFNLMCLLCSCRITFIWSSPAEASVTPLGKSENCIWCTIIHNNQSSSLLVYLVHTWKPFQKNVDQIGWHISNMIYNFFLCESIFRNANISCTI